MDIYVFCLLVTKCSFILVSRSYRQPSSLVLQEYCFCRKQFYLFIEHYPLSWVVDNDDDNVKIIPIFFFLLFQVAFQFYIFVLNFGSVIRVS